MDEKEDVLPIEMQRCSAKDVKLLDEEEFDFDLALTPSKGENRPSVCAVEDEDEVFFGAVGYKETIVAKTVEEKECKPMSPLNEKQQVEIFMEAQKIALLLQAEGRKHNPSPQNSPKLLDIPDINVSDSPIALKRRGPVTLDFNSPGEAKTEEVVPAKKRCLETTEEKEKPASNLQRSRSLRMPTTRKFGATGISQPGSGLKRPTVQKRERTVSENSPIHPNSSTTAMSPSKKARISTKPSLLDSSQLTSEPRRSPRLSVSTNQRIKSPPISGLAKPQIRKPSGLQPPQTRTQPTSKPSLLKGPISKLELIKPRKLQAPKGLKSEASGPVKAGPMKAMDMSSNSSVKTSPECQPLRARQPHIGTPVKREAFMAPKKLLAAAAAAAAADVTESSGLVTPKRSTRKSSVFATPCTPQSVTQSARRRSCLPTPGRSARSSLSSASAASTYRSATSASSMESPAVGIPSRSRVMHTPLVPEVPKSVKKPTGWTPVRRARPVAAEDEYFVCTKRTK